MDENYSKDFDENVRFRAKLIDRAEKDLELQAMIMKLCEHDFLYFLNVCAWTYNPKLDNSDRPFITYDFQDRFARELIACIENKRDSSTEKSREMGFSWILVGLQTWGFLFRKWASLYGSYKEDYVDEQGNMDSHFERVRYMLNRLPKWMKPSDIVQKYMNISSEQLGCSISGDAGQNFGTGGRRKFVIMDEFALWQYDTKAFRKTSDIADCRIIGATPEGRFNVYGKIMTHHKDYEHLAIKRFRLHWSDHPLKTQAWYEAEKLKRTALDIAKELDISYDESVTGAVYKDFQRIASFGEYEFNPDPDLGLYTSWDFGRDTTAILWIQKDFSTGLNYIIDAYENADKDIDFFQAFITGDLTQGFNYSDEEIEMVERHKAWKSKYMNHFGDPYNSDSRNVLSENTITKQLSKYGINIQTLRGTSVADRIKKTTLRMRELHVNSSLHGFIQAITQSRYPKVSEVSQATGERILPVHDQCSHFRTALEYYFDNEPVIVKTEKKLLESYDEVIKNSRVFDNL